jgi:c-di-GMP-binding flagellar brake protein YcgR
MSSHERRVYERVPFFKPVGLSAPPEGKGIDVRSFDISLGGVGLVCPRGVGLNLGASVAVTFQLTDPRRGPVIERVMGRVVHLRPGADACHVGVEFIEPVHPTTYPGLSRVIERL